MKEGKVGELAYNFTTSFQDDNGKRINPLHYINNQYANPMIANAVKKLPKDFDTIEEVVDSVKPIISDTRAKWYCAVMRLRYNIVLSYTNQGLVIDKFMSAVNKM